MFLVFEHAQHDLAKLVDRHYTQHKRSPFNQSEVKRLALQLLTALRFLHVRHVLHRDLKLSNLLYNCRGELRVCDFGLARRVDRGAAGDDGDDDADRRPCCLTPKVVSLWYRPPELLLGSERYDQGVDNWGAGCVLGELLGGRPLMDGRSELDQLQKMVSPFLAPKLPRLDYIAIITNQYTGPGLVQLKFDFLGPPSFDDWPVSSGNATCPYSVVGPTPSNLSLLLANRN